MLVEKLRQVLAGEDEASAEAAIGALMQKLRHKAARKPRGGDPDQLSKLQEALATQLEETRRAEQEQVEKQREATMELLSPRISSLGCAVLIGVAQTTLQEKLRALEGEIKGCMAGNRVEMGATVDEEIDRLRESSSITPETCTKKEDKELLFEELQRMNSGKSNKMIVSPGPPTTDYEGMSKPELLEKIKAMDSKLKSVVALVNKFQVNARLESALHKANKQQQEIPAMKTHAAGPGCGHSPSQAGAVAAKSQAAGKPGESILRRAG